MANDAYFQGNPVVLDTSRCSFNRKPRWTGTWNAGKLVPIFATSTVMPGDTVSMSISSAIRLSTPSFPTMDDMDITIEAYFVPHRLVLSRKSMSPDVNDANHSWSAFIGAQDSILNMPTPGDVKLPKQYVGSGGNYVVGGLADCLGFPAVQGTSASHYDVNPLKSLAYYSVWNDYFREPSTRNPVTYSIDSAGFLTFTGADAGVSSGNYYISKQPLAPVSRYHGYFGSALPWPQRNSTSVTMPLGDLAPVVTDQVDGISAVGATPIAYKDNVNGNPILFKTLITDQDGDGAAVDVTGMTTSGIQVAIPTNLYADLSEATSSTVNQFRLAVQTQRWYEQLARSGNKYSDMIHGMFGVRGESIQDKAEYLGGFTAPINITQVADTASNLGKTGAFSLSNPGGFLFKKSFVEHGTIIVVACCRVKDSFCQGISREDTKFDRFDYYWPQFANLGEQPIFEKEIYVNGVASNDDAVFGYQEAWAEYRFFPDKVTGYVKPTLTGGLAPLTYANNFSSAPDLKGFLNAENQVNNLDQTLIVSSATAGFQFFGQFQFDTNWVRPMPLYSIPGLVDHH